MFVVLENGQIKASYPPIRIDFNQENLPKNVLKTFEEAISCHAAGCYVAAAIMVRRTLEEICAERDAQGKDLKAKIHSLKSKIVIPDELFAGMSELHLLGNDAAHVEAREYANVADEEVVIALEFTKEILKALYQYSALLQKIRARKKQL